MVRETRDSGAGDLKYELLPGQSIKAGVRKLFRIRALRDFGYVRAGDIGGYIERELNLSHDGDAWVFDDAWVHGDAQVFGDAWVGDNARVSGDTRVSGNARVYGNAQVYGNALVSGDARVCGDAWVHGDARVSGNAWVSDNAQVSGNAWVSDNAQVSGNALVFSRDAVCWISQVGSEYGTLTAYTSRRGILVTRGCFSGTLGEFEAEVRKTHGDSQIAREYALLIEFIRLRLGAAQARVNAILGERRDDRIEQQDRDAEGRSDE